MGNSARRWTDKEIVAAFQRWANEHGGEPPKFRDWTRNGGGYWPTSFTVVNRCGSWNDGVEMAGLKPRPYGGQQGMPTPERGVSRETILRLRAKKRMTLKEIAERLGVSERTVSRRIAGSPARRPRKPRNAAERREARIAALKQALAKEEG